MLKFKFNKIKNTFFLGGGFSLFFATGHVLTPREHRCSLERTMGNDVKRSVCMFTDLYLCSCMWFSAVRCIIITWFYCHFLITRRMFFNLLKPTGHVMHQQFNIQQQFMCFVFIWEQTATCATYSINWLVFITEMKSVYCAVRTGSLNIWEQTATCATYSINWLVFITEMKSVYCKVRTGYLNKVVCVSSLKGLYSCHVCFLVLYFCFPFCVVCVFVFFV